MNWFQKMAIKLVWPKIKAITLGYVKSEEYQKKYVDFINKKIDIPRLSEELEEKLLNQIYDAGQEAIVEIIENFNVDEKANS